MNKTIINIIKEELENFFSEDFGLPGFETFDDLPVANRLPQVGSKRFDFEIKDGAIISDQIEPNKRYDYAITTDGKMIIGSQHYKMTKKADNLKTAGEIEIDENGKISYLNNESGHYKPGKPLLQKVIDVFRSKGLLSADFKADFLYQ